MKATLRMILECNGVMYYDVVQYNLTFQTFKSYMMSFAELYNFCKETESTDRDFGIEDAMLKCNPILRKVSVDEKTLETIRSCDEMECTTTLEGGSLYKLLKFGLENNCLIVDDDKKSWDNSYQVTFFRNIHFSSTTMTIYARMYNEQGLYNKMIVTMNKNDGRLVFHPSGNIFPSKADTMMTDRMNKLCELIGIPLLDHIIVGGDNRAFFSFKEKGMIDNPRITLSTDYRNLDIKSPLVAEQGKAR